MTRHQSSIPEFFAEAFGFLGPRDVVDFPPPAAKMTPRGGSTGPDTAGNRRVRGLAKRWDD